MVLVLRSSFIIPRSSFSSRPPLRPAHLRCLPDAGCVTIHLAANGGVVPEATGLGVERGFVRLEPVQRVNETNGLTEAIVRAELQQDERRHEWVRRHATEGDFGPDAVFFLHLREIEQPALDGDTL